MKTKTSRVTGAPVKAPTGITGFDAITGGGLPRARTTLLVGGPGSGKTVFALQFLVHGARQLRQSGIFVAFEEQSKHIVANADGFGWKLTTLRRNKITFMDAQPKPDLVQSGDFDLSGMLAALGAQITQTGATRIVFDALDIVLALLPDLAAKRREIYRLHEWLLSKELTSVITAKADDDVTSSISQRPFRELLFMVDCAVLLNHRVVAGVSLRTLRVQKFRGSSFDEDESGFVIGKTGLEVALARVPGRTNARVTKERVSSGVARLDTMLDGGYHRGASVLISGFAGTAKTTLSGTFAEAACKRGERTLFVSFDSDGAEVIRNLASVHIRLARYVSNGRLRIVSARTIAGSADTYLARIKCLAAEQKVRCLVIDPVSTWSTASDELTAHTVAEQLIDWCKDEGITVVFTRLLDDVLSQTPAGSASQISTLADTWIHLSYVVQGGERNRGLSIIKSRGTAHSNQVRELVLSDTGVDLADTYTAGGDVLMGTLRWERESAERAANESDAVADKVRRARLNAEEAELEAQQKMLQVTLEAKRLEQSLARRSSQHREQQLASHRSRISELRGADIVKPGRK